MARKARLALTLIALAAAVSASHAQGTQRRLTTIGGLRQFSSYFHQQNVLVHGEFVESGSKLVLRGGDRDIDVLLNDARAPTGLVEVRGQLIDVGRLEPADPRLRAYPGIPDPERWPRPGELLVLNVTSVGEAQLMTTASLRALALQPWRFEGQPVTLVGQFRGRNLFGDLPSAPGRSRYDFVLRAADAAVWVTDLRPRGRGFDLSVDARVDTGRWLQITGVMSQERGLVAVAGSTIATAEAPELPPAEEETLAAAPPPEPGEVIFSAPTEGDVDIPVDSTVRLQFSRGLDERSLADRIRIGYLGATTTQDAVAAPVFAYAYDAGTRAIEIRFAQPLEPFRTVRIEVLDGMRTFDGAPVQSWMLTFSLGGS